MDEGTGMDIVSSTSIQNVSQGEWLRIGGDEYMLPRLNLYVYSGPLETFSFNIGLAPAGARLLARDNGTSEIWVNVQVTIDDVVLGEGEEAVLKLQSEKTLRAGGYVLHACIEKVVGPFVLNGPPPRHFALATKELNLTFMPYTD
ncbi:MAG: hypothetical protein HY556_08680 [Euryarchaeota archaeon]|nr:hypothetical protein [Euryarchaeota archaeon]